jgi:hypothetical protein
VDANPHAIAFRDEKTKQPIVDDVPACEKALLQIARREPYGRQPKVQENTVEQTKGTQNIGTAGG